MWPFIPTDAVALRLWDAGGRKADKTGGDAKKTDLRRTIHVPVHAEIVLWLLGLVLLLPMSWGVV